jgi:hypothetical protein
MMIDLSKFQVNELMGLEKNLQLVTCDVGQGGASERIYINEKGSYFSLNIGFEKIRKSN